MPSCSSSGSASQFSVEAAVGGRSGSGAMLLSSSACPRWSCGVVQTGGATVAVPPAFTRGGAAEALGGVRFGSVLKKRMKKMRKHKLRKLRRKLRRSTKNR